MVEIPPSFDKDPEAYRADWERWRATTDARLDELRGDVPDLIRGLHDLTEEFIALKTQVNTWAKVLIVLITISGIVIPVALTLSGNSQ